MEYIIRIQGQMSTFCFVCVFVDDENWIHYHRISTPSVYSLHGESMELGRAFSRTIQTFGNWLGPTWGFCENVNLRQEGDKTGSRKASSKVQSDLTAVQSHRLVHHSCAPTLNHVPYYKFNKGYSTFSRIFILIHLWYM